MQWLVTSRREIFSSVPFKVEALELVDQPSQKPLSHPYHRLTCPDWVNVLPLTDDGQAVLIRQPRAGSLSTVLEIPGGMIDAGEAPEAAARRELEEETGYRADTLKLLGSINPNPAIMNNTQHMFLATSCQIPDQRAHFPDENEACEVVLVPADELENLVKNRKIDHALAALTILMSRDHDR